MNYLDEGHYNACTAAYLLLQECDPFQTSLYTAWLTSKEVRKLGRIYSSGWISFKLWSWYCCLWLFLGLGKGNVCGNLFVLYLIVIFKVLKKLFIWSLCVSLLFGLIWPVSTTLLGRRGLYSAHTCLELPWEQHSIRWQNFKLLVVWTQIKWFLMLSY